MTRAGIVTVVGKPNVGKSTLLNRIVGQKLSITSEKPQSTRDRIVGIHTTDTAQLVILDTPGLLNPRYALQRAMRSTAVKALDEADVILYLADATQGTPSGLAEAAGLSRLPKAPVVVVLNKADLVDSAERDRLLAEIDGAALISAVTGEGVDALLERVTAALPESPFLYPEDELSTQTMRFFAAELVRETALEQLEEEVPYSIACEVEEFRESRTPIYIRAILYVERESQKGIVLGERGGRIREIGRVSRQKIEALVGAPVYLDLWVKVLPNWRKSERSMRRFGYRLSEDTTT